MSPLRDGPYSASQTSGAGNIASIAIGAKSYHSSKHNLIMNKENWTASQKHREPDYPRQSKVGKDLSNAKEACANFLVWGDEPRYPR